MRALTAGLAMLTMAGCAGRMPVFRVVKPGGELALESPATARQKAGETVVFSKLMERQYGFTPGQGYLDLLPGMRVSAQRAYFKGSDIKLSEYLGAETGRWTVEPGMRFRFAGSQPEPGLRKPAGEPAIETLIGRRARTRLRFYRMFFQVRWFAAGRDAGRGSVILGAADKETLTAATAMLLGEKPVECGGARLDCIPFPPATTVTADVGLQVNGEQRWVAWGSTLKSLAPAGAAASLRVERRLGKRLAPVDLGRDERAEAWGFPLLPGDRVQWASSAGAGAATERVVTSGGAAPIAFDTRGAGETALVFIHGWACDRSFWREQVDVFARHYRVVTLDLTGHGPFSPPSPPRSVLGLSADVEAVVRDLGLRRVILVGHSMGGPVALSAARRLPGIVRGVVLVDTLHDPSTRVTPEMTAGIARDLEADFAGAMEKMVRTQFVAGVNDKARDWVIERARKADPATALSLLRDYPSINFGMLLTDGGANVPIRAINASATKIDAARRFAPDFDAVIMQGAGHFPHLERPAEFNETLRALLAGFR